MTKQAAIYCRISNDDKDKDRPDARGVTVQEREGREYLKRRGYTLAKVYVDNDLGASRRSRNKARPEWDRLLADVRAGDVQVVLARDLDRLTRKMREIEDLVDLYDETQIEFDLWRGHLDLSNAAGQSIARMLGMQAAGESDRTSERMKSQRRDAAMRGEPVRAEDGFGWKQGRHVAKEAAAIRDGAEMVIAGSTLEAVAREWNRRGLKRRKSERAWWGPQVRVVLLNPRHEEWGCHIFLTSQISITTHHAAAPPEVEDVEPFAEKGCDVGKAVVGDDKHVEEGLEGEKPCEEHVEHDVDLD